MATKSVDLTTTPVVVSIFRVDMPAAPEIGYPEPGSSWFISLDGEKFYEAGTDVTTAPLEALQAFWAECEPRYDPEAKVTHCRVHATVAYVRGLRHNGWAVTEIAWEGGA